jgi:DNA polymerase (family X)
MNKDQVAAILSEIGTLLELKGENSFRCNAYHNAARAIEQLETDLKEIVAQGKLGEIRGIGDTLKEKITTLVTTGHLPFYEDLKAKIPAGLLDMLRIQGLGPKKVKALHDQLGIDSLDKLTLACDQGTVATLKGFGAKTQQKILEGIAFLKLMGSRVRIDQGLPLALSLLEGMRNAPGIQRMELCGSLRRRKETIKDIDILISSDDPAPLMERFVKLPGVEQIIGQGDTKSSIIVNGEALGIKVHINADLRVVSDKDFPFALLYFTGSKEHNIVLRQRAIGLGLKLNEYELAGADKKVPCKDEEDIYRALGMAYVPPEMREDTGEIDAALQKKVPQLVEVSQIQGVFHNHTVASDGANTLDEMAEAARALGLKYLGFGDHSQSLTIANGLSPERVRQQQAAIDALNKRLKGIHLFKGIECDILEDGRLDFDDEVLDTFDYVVASVHSYFNQTREEMTARIIRAIRHPAVTMLGHATGRLLLRRDGYQVDLEAVLQAAAETGTMIEINAHPQRLDLDWVHCKRAKALGVKLVINPDAHSTADLALYRYGVDVARRGWLTREDVYNTQSLEEIRADLRRRHQHKKGKPSSSHAKR